MNQCHYMFQGVTYLLYVWLQSAPAPGHVAEYFGDSDRSSPRVKQYYPLGRVSESQICEKQPLERYPKASGIDERNHRCGGCPVESEWRLNEQRTGSQSLKAFDERIFHPSAVYPPRI